MKNETRTYVPKCYAKEVGEYGRINIGFDVDELIKFANQHKTEKGKLKLTLTRRKEVGQYGDTHCVMLDTFVPQQQGGQRQQKPAQKPAGYSGQKPESEEDSDPVPF